ncbi:hypothetical protein DFP73DRAFT_561273 [Morchella snyderi]|nr:hypothetical protein DFP73DRAFT_561273 [Morchella snyderi]
MADPEQQPDFNTVADTMNDMSRSHATLAVQFDRMRNVPALDHGAQILAQLANIVERLGNIERRLDSFELRLDAGDYNAVARLANSSLAIMAESQLVPLRTRRNQEVDGFPMTQGDIDRLSSADLNRLLESYGLPTVGQIAVRRRQLKKYLGITVVGI